MSEWTDFNCMELRNGEDSIVTLFVGIMIFLHYVVNLMVIYITSINSVQFVVIQDRSS